MILFVLTLARYRRWCGTDYENWLASTVTDPYVDLVPPVVNLGLEHILVIGGILHGVSWPILYSQDS